MVENVIFISIVGLAVTELIFIVGLLILNSKIGKLKTFESDYEFIRMIQKDNNDIIKKMCDAVDEERETYEHMYQMLDLLAEQYSKLFEQYNIILKQYKSIDENYKKLLTCWGDVQNASDYAAEQFLLCTEELKKIQKVLEPWVLDADQLGEEYVEEKNGIQYTYISEEEDPDNPFVESENYKKIKPIQPEDYVNLEKIDEMSTNESFKKRKADKKKETVE